jgi:hypothetical protein
VTGSQATTSVGSVTATGGSVVSVDGIQITPAVGSVLIWQEIIPGQDGNWQDIDDSQTPTWVAVDSSQTPSWSTIDDSQTPSWTAIDDSQSPNWKEVA